MRVCFSVQAFGLVLLAALVPALARHTYEPPMSLLARDLLNAPVVITSADVPVLDQDTSFASVEERVQSASSVKVAARAREPVIPSVVMRIAEDLVNVTLRNCEVSARNQLAEIVECFENLKGTSGVLPRIKFICRGPTYAEVASKVSVTDENKIAIDYAMKAIQQFCNNQDNCVFQQCTNVKRVLKYIVINLRTKELEPRQRNSKPTVFNPKILKLRMLPTVMSQAFNATEQMGAAPVTVAGLSGDTALGVGTAVEDPNRFSPFVRAFHRFRRATIYLCWPSDIERDVSKATLATKLTLLDCYHSTKLSVRKWCVQQRRAFPGCSLDISSLLQLSDRITSAHSPFSRAPTVPPSHEAVMMELASGAGATTTNEPSAANLPPLQQTNVQDLLAALQLQCANCECFTNVCAQVENEIDKLTDTAQKLPVNVVNKPASGDSDSPANGTSAAVVAPSTVVNTQTVSPVSTALQPAAAPTVASSPTVTTAPTTSAPVTSAPQSVVPQNPVTSAPPTSNNATAPVK